VSLPGWYRSWAVARGLSPFHPEAWSAGERAAFRAERLRQFTAKWRFYRDAGIAAIYHGQGAREALIRWVRDDVRDALGPAPVRNPWADCPCHPAGGTPVYDEIGLPGWPEGVDERAPVATPDATEAFVAAAPFERAPCSPGLAQALAYLDTFRPHTGGDTR